MSLPRMLRWHNKKLTSDPDWDPFKQRVGGAPLTYSTLCEMDMDYMKNLVPYDDEVADPIIGQLAVDLEWVTAIKKAPSAVSLETNDEADIADDEPLGRSIHGSPLVSGFSDIDRGGPGRMCNAQSSDTDVREELEVVNGKLHKSYKIAKQIEECSNFCRQDEEAETNQEEETKDVLKPVSEEDKKLLCEWFDKKEKFLKNFLTGSYGWSNMCTTWYKIKEAASKEGKDLDFCETVDAGQFAD
ncbi:hypothetical protein A4A49_07254 [Nicotiana attenuata]|uniref:Uncharacterized protein n=1 Tax=Nicotiana attenuata TaxID=49451 RepID=A0A314LAK5_NICAT|nr:hypothetical protein A4A49_07254 [Nicotiana attenuata]